MHGFVNVYFLFLFLPTIWEIRGFVSEKAILMIFSQGRKTIPLCFNIHQYRKKHARVDMLLRLTSEV